MLKLNLNVSKNNLISQNFTPHIVNDNEVDNSDTTNNLSVTFVKEHLEDLLEIPNCNGIKMYPGVENNELVMVAVPAAAPCEDLSDVSHFCFTGYRDDSIHTTSRMSSVEEASGMKSASNSNEESGINLWKIIDLNLGSQSKGLNVYFPNSFILGMNGDSIRFDVVELEFSDNAGSPTYRSIIARASNSNEKKLSFLPCPPNCGGDGGSYDNSTYLEMMRGKHLL